MKIMIFIAITIALIAGAVTQEMNGVNSILDSMNGQAQKEIFKAFHYLHEKTYELNSQEGLNKYRTFKANVEWIKNENAKLGEQIYGITEFSDMTHQQFVDTMLVKTEVMQAHIDDMEKKSLRFLHEDHHDDHHEHHHHHHDDHHADTKKSAGDHDLKEKTQKDHDLKASSYQDWSKYDGPVKNQRTCGSCWAFAALGAIESEYQKKKGAYVSFSEQYLVDCDNEDSGCSGGWPSRTFSWILKNGIIANEALPYVSKAQACSAKLKPFEYKIVTGSIYHSPQAYWSQATFDELITQGPVIVAMDASFSGFMQYRPSSLRPVFVKGACSKVTHAVVVVGKQQEKGIDYYKVRNSWGVSWGYKGYFMIQTGNCMLDNWGWMPKVDPNGFVPDSKHPPKPKPVPSDCVELYGANGFDSSPLKKACDAVPRLGGIRGVKFPKVQKNSNLKVGLFFYTTCYGVGSPNWDQHVVAESSVEFARLNGAEQTSSSMAFYKKASEGCVDFYTTTCMEGASSFSICNDIKDSQDVQLGELVNTKSINLDADITKIVFYSEAHYSGRAYTITNSLFNIGSNWTQGSFIRSGAVRSIKIFK